MRKNGYHGNKLCPGCQRDTWRRSVDTVCDECLHNIEAGKKALADLAKGETKAMGLQKPVYIGTWQMPKGHYFNREAYAHQTMKPPTVSFREGEFSDTWLSKEIDAFLESLAIHPDTPTAPEFHRIHHSDGYMSMKDEIKVKAEHGIAWLRFYDSISRYMKFLQERAKEEGGNLLFRLVKEEVGFQPLTKKETEHEQR